MSRIVPDNPQMILRLQRTLAAEHSTLGFLSVLQPARQFLAYTLEDAAREVKLQDITCIPRGSYEIRIRRGSGLSNRYDAARKSINHNGMLWLQDVPNYEWIYIHIGNQHTHSSGCILVGDGQRNTGEGSILDSRACYERIYPAIYEAADRGDCKLEIYDPHHVDLPDIHPENL